MSKVVKISRCLADWMSQDDQQPTVVINEIGGWVICHALPKNPVLVPPQLSNVISSTLPRSTAASAATAG